MAQTSLFALKEYPEKIHLARLLLYGVSNYKSNPIFEHVLELAVRALAELAYL